MFDQHIPALFSDEEIARGLTTFESIIADLRSTDPYFAFSLAELNYYDSNEFFKLN